jgi:hypothetical protein
MRKKGRDKIRLVIDAFTPDTLPMSRLAEYLRHFSELLGNDANVHFDKVEKSSAALAAYSDNTATPKIKERLEKVMEGIAPSGALKSNHTIDDMLLQDNAIGFVDLGGKTKLLEFPGRKRAPQERVGPVRRRTVLDGQIFQIGGKDETINVHIRNPYKAGETHRCVVSIELARKLAPYFLGATVRMIGEGDWYRTESGWSMSPNSYTAFDFVPLDDIGLEKTILSARGLFADVKVDGTFLDKLRHE